MPVFPEEPEIHESIPGPGVPFPRESDARAPRTPVPAGAARPVPGPRPAAPRPGPRPGPPPARRPGTPVQLVPSTTRGAVDRADDTIDRLLESGRRPGTVLVLTVGEPHPWQQHEIGFGEERYWAQLADGGDVFYADAAATRTVGREVVVLVVNSPVSADRLAEAARVAHALAGELLMVCGDVDTVAPLFPGAGTPVPA
ncbi:hypothetical protein GCM10009664_45290 [Kitasatospora gansuensis]